MGSKWKHTQFHQQDLLTGWLILPSEQVEELVVNSGGLGVFAQVQDKNGGPIPWFQRQSKAAAEIAEGQAANYLLRGAPKMWQTDSVNKNEKT